MEFPKAGSGPNRKQIIDALRNTAQSASNMVAENASMPVDALAWALRKMGVPVGDKPVMGSDWMREKGLTAPTQEGASKVVGDTIGMISPMGFTKQGAQAMIDAGSKLKGLPVGMSIKDVSGPQSQALMLAQQRAALPVEQGGLGLAAGNTPAERAAAMGFDTDTFHGTNYDISKLDRSFLGSNTGAKSANKGFFSAGHPRTTYAYIDNGVTGTDPTMALMHGKSFDQLEKELIDYAKSRNLQPYQVRDQFYENLPNKYYDSLKSLASARALALKEMPGVKLMGRHIPNMDQATPQQIKSLADVDDQIEELKALANMVVRQPSMTNEIDDISEIATNNLMAGANIMPLKINSSKANTYDDLNAGFRNDTFSNRMDETINDAKDLAIIKNTQDGFKKSDTIYGVVNPDVVRSRFAAFDPFRKTAATAALMGVAAPDLLAQERDNGNR